MKTFPIYDVNSHVDRGKRRLKITLTSRTICGPVVTANHEIRLLTLEPREIESGIQLCIVAAYEKLKKQVGKVEKFCAKKGLHNH
jgi:hypothetical protein